MHLWRRLGIARTSSALRSPCTNVHIHAPLATARHSPSKLGLCTRLAQTFVLLLQMVSSLFRQTLSLFRQTLSLFRQKVFSKKHRIVNKRYLLIRSLRRAWFSRLQFLHFPFLGNFESLGKYNADGLAKNFQAEKKNDFVSSYKLSYKPV